MKNMIGLAAKAKASGERNEVDSETKEKMEEVTNLAEYWVQP